MKRAAEPGRACRPAGKTGFKGTIDKNPKKFPPAARIEPRGRPEAVWSGPAVVFCQCEFPASPDEQGGSRLLFQTHRLAGEGGP